MKLKYKCILLFFSISCNGQGPFISNPSFESNITGPWPPSGWEACNDYSTPDTQPIPGDFEIEASKGSYFLGMAARGITQVEPKNEGVQTFLERDLTADGCYQLSIDLAKAFVIDGMGISYPNSMRLFIWGGTDYCDKKVKLVETDYIEHEEWKTYSFSIFPEDTIETLLFEVIADDDDRGYMVLDNIVIVENRTEKMIVKMDSTIRPDDQVFLNASVSDSYNWTPREGLSCYDCPSPQVMKINSSDIFTCELLDENGCLYKEVFKLNINIFIPNVFTPNEDGVNDVFKIDGLEQGSVLKIFNRRGQLIYENMNYNNDWNGKDTNGNPMNEDTYWYVLNIPGNNIAYKGYVYLKR